MHAYPPRQGAMAAYQTARETVDAGTAIVLLYEGAIRRLYEARKAILEGKIEERYHSTMKAYAIISGLHSQIDFNNGGEIAKQLDIFYSYILQRITIMNVKEDVEICNELINILKKMLESWRSIVGQMNHSNHLEMLY
ncbi:MAG: flagellar export chaperone FliS [Geminicoccaceae bacterium]|nr:flagellar export chaperone FliS [Geminicoccaceae bacterium]